MKKTILILTIVLAGFSSSFAQAFGEGSKLISLGLGASNMYHVGYFGYYAGYRNSYYAPITGELTVQGEFAVHKYVGLGFNVGIGGRAGAVGLYRGYGYYTTGYNPEFNIPIGFIANFHFYQLIADKKSGGSNLHADKLDIYAGINIGSGVAIHPGVYDSNGNTVTGIDALVWGGVQAGARYYFTPKVSVFAEVGFGKSIVNGGITWNLGNK